MPSLNIFSTDAFSTVSLTQAVERVPYLPMMLGEMNIFDERPVRTKQIMIEERSGVLSLVPTTARGAPPVERDREIRKVRNFRAVRLAVGDTITVDEIQDIRAFGSETELMQMQAEVARRIAGPTGCMRQIEYTLENMRLGAIQGVLPDADGSIIYNWYTEFDVTQPDEINFALNDSTTDLTGKCSEVVRAMAREAQGAWISSTRVVALCGDTFYDQFRNHPKFRETYTGWSDASVLRMGTAFEGFRFDGIDFWNYRGSDDNSTIAIPPTKAKFFPVGAPGVFEVAWAPAEFEEWVNRPGQPIVAIPIRDNDRHAWWRVELYSYPLFYCTRPRMLQRARNA